MIIMILDIMIILLLAVIFHEAGHVMYYKFMLDIKPTLKFYHEKWQFGFEITPEILYQNDRFNMLLWGVALGGMVILAVPLFHPIIKFSVFAAYLAGCSSDIKLMAKEIRRG